MLRVSLFAHSDAYVCVFPDRFISNCEHSLFCSKICGNERKRTKASGEAASRQSTCVYPREFTSKREDLQSRFTEVSDFSETRDTLFKLYSAWSAFWRDRFACSSNVTWTVRDNEWTKSTQTNKIKHFFLLKTSSSFQANLYYRLWVTLPTLA